MAAEANSNKTKKTFEGMATLTEDMGGFVTGLADNIFGSKLPKNKLDLALESARQSFPRYMNIMQKTFPGSVFPIDEVTINNFYYNAVRELIEKDPKVIILNCDNYILRGVTDFPENLFRLGILRYVSGSKTVIDFEKLGITELAGITTRRMGERLSRMHSRPEDALLEIQLDEIEKTLNKHDRSLRGAHVVMLDDNTTGGGTESTVEELMKSRGAIFNRSESIFTMKNFVGPYDEKMDRDNVMITNVQRTASTEQRELGPWGGRPIVTSLHYGITLMTAPMFPFGDGEEDRSEGLLHKLSLDLIKLDTSIQVLEEIEKIFEGEIRKDGKSFTFFTFGDFKHRLPTRHDGAGILSPSAAIRQYTSEHGHAPTSLEDIGYLDYLRLAKKEVEKTIRKSKISTVSLDLVGTISRLKYPHKYLKGFKNSTLGEKLNKLMHDLANKYGYADQTTIDVDDPLKMLRDIGFNDEINLFVNYGLEMMEKRFIDFYGNEEIGQQKMQYFLSSHSHLPLVYHAFRELTWGQINLNDVYEPDEDQAAKNFSIKIINAGTQLIFATQAPMIHAMDVLKRANLASLIVEEKALLLTMEDQLDADLNDIGLSRIYMHLFGGFNEELLAIGDQRNDIIPIMRSGGLGYIVDGPEQLENVLEYTKLVSPKKRRVNK